LSAGLSSLTGKLPETWGVYMVKVLRYQWRIYAYLYGWTEEYPGFDVPSRYANPGGYPAVLQAVPDATRNRLTALLRAIWVIPTYAMVYFVGIAASCPAGGVVRRLVHREVTGG
jgi:hypothetical protein